MEKFKIADLQINKKVQFTNNKNFFEGTIIKIQDNFLGILISSFQDNFKIFTPNEITNFLIVYEEKAYWCNSTVIGCKAEDHAQLIIIDQPRIINKIERRKSPRVPTVLDIEYCFLPDDMYKISEVPQQYHRMKKRTFTVDISGGGICLITYEKVPIGKLALLSFNIKDNITSVCSVVRSEASDGDTNFKTALKFVDLSVSHHNIIMEYINKRL